MRVLFASRRPAYPFFQGGAERSFYELARALAAAGHPVAMLGECHSELDGLHHLDDFFAGSEVVEQRWESETVVVQGRQMPSRQVLILRLPGTFEVLHTFLADYRWLLEDVVRGFQPDVICTQLEGSLEVVEFCGFSRARVLHFVRDAYYPFNFHVLSNVFGSRPAPECIANSLYTSDFLRTRLGIEARVLYPIVRATATTIRRAADDVVDDDREDGGNRILFTNPAPLKGGELMFEVVRRLQDVRFLVLPGWAAQVPERWHRLPNVETRPWPVLDMDAAYRSADLVVVPTQHSEGFGRVAIEAQLCGTPVLASRHSGLAEILADSALMVDDYCEVDAWVQAIRQALAAPRQLARLARDGRVNAKRFGPQPIREAFEKIMRDLDD